MDASKLVASKPDVDAAKIASLHGEIMAAVRVGLGKAIEIGELLDQKKRDLPHGEFLHWTAKNLPFSHKTATRYMRVWEERDRLKLDAVSNLTDAYRLLSGGTADVETPSNALQKAYETLKKLRDSTELERGRFIFGEIADPPGSDERAQLMKLGDGLLKAGEMMVGVGGGFLYAIEHAPGGRFYVGRVAEGEARIIDDPGYVDDGSAMVDAAYRPLTFSQVNRFWKLLGDDLDGVAWETFPAFSKPTRLNSWMFGRDDVRAREAA